MARRKEVVMGKNKKDEKQVALDGCEDMRESLFFLVFLKLLLFFFKYFFIFHT